MRPTILKSLDCLTLCNVERVTIHSVNLGQSLNQIRNVTLVTSQPRADRMSINGDVKRLWRIGDAEGGRRGDAAILFFSPRLRVPASPRLILHPCLSGLRESSCDEFDRGRVRAGLPSARA